MNSTRKTSLLSITLSAVLLSGLIAPSLPQAFAGNGADCLEFNGVSALDDLCAPFFFGFDDTVFRHWTDQGILGDTTKLCENAEGVLVEDQSTPWFTDESTFDSAVSEFGPGFEADFSQINNGFAFFIPNLVDPLKFKDMHIQLTFCEKSDSQGGNLALPDNGGSQPIIQNVVGIDNWDDQQGTGDENGCGFVNSGSTLPDTQGAIYFFEDWFCEPNPDFETFDIVFNTDDWILVQVVVDTWTWGHFAVGGIFEGVNTGALLVAGAQANALWLIPLITAIGIGIVIVNRKRFF